MDSVVMDNWNTGLVLVRILFKTEFDLELEMFKYLKLKPFYRQEALEAQINPLKKVKRRKTVL